ARDPRRVIELVEQAMAQCPLAQNPNPELLSGYAPVLLLADATDVYRQQCARVMAQLHDTKEPRTAFLVARICALGPDSAADPAKLVQIAERAVQPQRGAHYLHALGLAYYRAGEFEKAI